MKHAVVIGSGMGGLTSAILLAQNGYSVTVHEQHNRPGGLLHRFFRQGASYDTGFHYCGGIARDDILGAALRHLGVFDQLDFLPLDPDGFDRLVAPGLDFAVPVGWERYRAALKQQFPREAAGIDRYLQDCMDAVSNYGLYAFRAEIDVPTLLKWEGISVQQVVDRAVTDPGLKAALTMQCVLYGVSPDQAPFGLHAVIVHHFVRGAYRIRGGGDRLAKVMVDRIKALGGQVRLKSEVTQVLVDGRVATGVELADGTQERADLVISNMHPRLLLDLLPEGSVRKAYKRRVMGQRLGWAHLGVYLKVDQGAPELGNANLYRTYDLDVSKMYRPTGPDRTPFYFATAPNEGLGPERRARHDVVLMLTAMSWDQVSQWAGTSAGQRPQAYLDTKQALMDPVINALRADFPDLGDRIVRSEASTALTTWHYTRAAGGATYGHYHSVDQMGRYRPSQFIKVRGVVQVGHGVFAPGVLGTCLSAYYGIGAHLGKERLLEELKAV